MRKSLKVALIAVFAAAHAILYFLSFGLWRSWAIYLEPIEGILLGPWAGFSAALMGSTLARMIRPIENSWMFGIVAEPLGALASGLLAKGNWRLVMGLYVVMLTAYFTHPYGTWFPLWTILDILVAFMLIYPATKISRGLSHNDARRLSISVALTSFIGTATDSLARIFLLVPAGFYLLLGLTPEGTFTLFTFGAFDSYIEDILTLLTSFVVLVPLLVALQRIPRLRNVLS